VARVPATSTPPSAPASGARGTADELAALDQLAQRRVVLELDGVRSETHAGGARPILWCEKPQAPVEG
jgi:hypothetical protein